MLLYFLSFIEKKYISAISKVNETDEGRQSNVLLLRSLSRLGDPDLKYKLALLYGSIHFTLNDAIVDVVKATGTEDVEILTKLLLMTNDTKKLEEIFEILDTSSYCYENKKMSNDTIVWTRGNFLE